MSRLSALAINAQTPTISAKNPANPLKQQPRKTIELGDNFQRVEPQADAVISAPSAEKDKKAPVLAIISCVASLVSLAGVVVLACRKPEVPPSVGDARVEASIQKLEAKLDDLGQQLGGKANHQHLVDLYNQLQQDFTTLSNTLAKNPQSTPKNGGGSKPIPEAMKRIEANIGMLLGLMEEVSTQQELQNNQLNFMMNELATQAFLRRKAEEAQQPAINGRRGGDEGFIEAYMNRMNSAAEAVQERLTQLKEGATTEEAKKLNKLLGKPSTPWTPLQTLFEDLTAENLKNPAVLKFILHEMEQNLTSGQVAKSPLASAEICFVKELLAFYENPNRPKEFNTSAKKDLLSKSEMNFMPIENTLNMTKGNFSLVGETPLLMEHFKKVIDFLHEKEIPPPAVEKVEPARRVEPPKAASDGTQQLTEE